VETRFGEQREPLHDRGQMFAALSRLQTRVCNMSSPKAAQATSDRLRAGSYQVAVVAVVAVGKAMIRNHASAWKPCTAP
jgi:beta-lactamase regulating signal transducer with metallopeptidase domain